MLGPRFTITTSPPTRETKRRKIRKGVLVGPARTEAKSQSREGERRGRKSVGFFEGFGIIYTLVGVLYVVDILSHGNVELWKCENGGEIVNKQKGKDAMMQSYDDAMMLNRYKTKY